MALKRIVRSPSFLAALLATSVATANVEAGDGFIKQPKLRSATQQEEAGALVVAAPSQVANVEMPASAPITIPQDQPTTGETLRWVSRGTTARVASSASSKRNLSPPASKPSGVVPTLDASIPVVKVRPASVSKPEPSATELQAAQRAQLASRISQQITHPAGDESPKLRSVGAVDAPSGWQAVGEQLSHRIRNCESLLKRNAFLSAREEAEKAVLHLVRHLDLISNSYRCEPAWLSAQQTLRESEDFALAQRLSSDRSLLRRFIDSHETSTLKNADVENLSPLAASQHYRQQAERSLLTAAQQSHPWASEAYYAIGRTFQAQADAGGEDAEALRWRAATYYRAAQAVDPNNAIAANQLGFMMLQMDRPLDAAQVLNAAVNVAPTQANLQNLVEASRRLGDTATQEWAMQNLAMFRSQPQQMPAIPQVTEVAAPTFAAMSPYMSGPGQPAQQSNRSAARPTSTQY